MMLLGVIADDFTGATDVASFLVENGIATVQLNEIPAEDTQLSCQAVVISLKTRSCSPQNAVAQSLTALRWLQRQACRQIYFKYCSTFDSTSQGNIGPVTDALMAAMDIPFTVFSPALPVNGRTVWQGYLFVLDKLLAESGMRHHPVNPMTDSYLPRLVEMQAGGRCAVIPGQTIDRGADAVKAAIAQLQREGYRYAVLDALTERHLVSQGEALRDMPLVTGGSGLAAGLARQWPRGDTAQARQAGWPVAGKGVVLSGSCSEMTNRQVAHYRRHAPYRNLEVARCMDETRREAYARELALWVENNSEHGLAPLIAATLPAAELAETQQQFGAVHASQAVEALFAALSRHLLCAGVTKFIVAGGETSGVVTQSLGVSGFHIGPAISPGVPWVRAVDQPISLALKSGNFGDEAFFTRAQKEFSA